MSELARVEAIADCGLVGDRYAERKNRRSADYQVTLIEIENIEAFNQSTGLLLTADAPRRNLVTKGIRLNNLCGKQFTVGTTLLEGLELCEPCRLFAKRTDPQVLTLFKGKGGLRARVVTGGLITVGDEIRELA